MKKTLILLFVFLLRFVPLSHADEGMWIPLLLQQLNEKEMQSMGMKLSAEDIYSINKSSLKDAIVLFGGGCTAEIISDQGLMITNHHCGFRQIQSHSSLEHDYLANGFWAMNLKEELSNPGLTVTLLIRMEDVTEKVLDGVQPGMPLLKREAVISANIKKIQAQATKGTHYDAKVKPFYYGNEYYMFITETFSDIRLVGAPPSSIGKFGGDTDNWMWPRHTGDFSLFRIYTDKDNNPAEYSENNQPYKPNNHLSVSLKGVKEGDFTFVFGYPGTTEEYLPSFAIKMITQDENPVSISLRQEKLDIIGVAMAKDRQVGIQYAAKHASIANYWKKMIGENRGIKRLDGIARKQKLETKFTEWANQSPERKALYGGLVADFEKTYKDITPHNIGFRYFFEAGHGVYSIRYAWSFRKLVETAKAKSATDEQVKGVAESYMKSAKAHFKDYNEAVEKNLLATMLKMYYEGLPENMRPVYIDEIHAKYKGDFSAFAETVASKSVLFSEDNTIDMLENANVKTVRKLEKDPLYKLAISMYFNYIQVNLPVIRTLQGRLDSLQRLYMKGLMEMMPEKRFYPDANSTLRVAYGKVMGYEPRDGVRYNYFTTMKGIIDKEDPDISDYKVEPKLKALYAEKDYGQYADADGSLHVCFIASNHTTGGNSGSPVLDAEGNLIGINFDRCWEGTMSDLMYDPEQCRNIALDVRYALFVIDKYAGASHLIKEMSLIK